MPTIEIIDGIRIKIYNGDHMPPHIHAKYNELEVVIAIESCRILAGSLSKNQLKKVIDYISENKVRVLEMFNQLNPKVR